MRRLLSSLVMHARRDASKDAELLVLRPKTRYCAGKPAGSATSQPAGRLWLAALSRPIPRRRWTEVFAVTPGDAPGLAPATGRTHVGRRGPASTRMAVHRGICVNRAHPSPRSGSLRNSGSATAWKQCCNPPSLTVVEPVKPPPA